MKWFMLSVFFCYFFYTETHAITMLEPDCATRAKIPILAQEDLEALNKMSIFALTMSLSNEARELLIDVCGRQKETPEQIPCLDDFLSDNSFTFPRHGDRPILLHIRDHFDSLRGAVWTYNKEVKRCKDYYYTYDSLGFCIPYTGRECLDHDATIGFNTVWNERCLYHKTRVFLTPNGTVKEELYEGICRSK